MQTAFHLTGKTILITGASSGIGRQAAISCSVMGGKIILSGRNADRLNDTLKNLQGSGHEIIAGDLLDESTIKLISDSVPGLDGVVHTAGIVQTFPIQFLTTKKIEEIMRINFYSAVQLTTALFKAKKINDGASFVFLSSISGQNPRKGLSLYAASKSAIEAFAKTLTSEYAHRKIRSNCISPAMVKTPMYDQAATGIFEQSMDKHISKYPLGVGYPEDVANAIIYFLSPASRWVTGVNLNMDGGLLFSS